MDGGRQYVSALVDLARRERAHWFIPVSYALTAALDAKAAEKIREENPETRYSIWNHIWETHRYYFWKRCLCPSAALVRSLDDNLSFLGLCGEAGLRVPDCRPAQDKGDVKRMREEGLFDDPEKRFFLKPLKQFSEHRLDFTR